VDDARGRALGRFLPDERGHRSSVCKRCAGWQEKGVWQMLIAALAEDAEPA
jgi:hypothetical protein